MDELRPADFERFRAALAKGVDMVRLKSKINRFRVVFMYANKNLKSEMKSLIDLDDAFDRPSAKALRKAKYAAESRIFEREEILALLDKADPIMKAQILLGLNGGLGNTDIAELPKRAVNLDGGWLIYPRPKTQIKRRIPLWSETVSALQEAIKLRPEPADAADAGLCFLTSRGNKMVRIQKTRETADVENDNLAKYSTTNSLARQFEALIEQAGVADRRGARILQPAASV